MKFFAAFLYLISVLVLASCGPQVTFTEPQPQGKKNRAEFKQNYTGNYLLERDSSLMILLRPDKVVARQQVNIAEPLTFFDSSNGWWLVNGRLYGEVLESNGTPVTLRNDSVFGNVSILDTLFEIGDDQVLRYYKGRYFLNKSVGPQEWQVRSIWKEGDNLIMADINYSEDIERMKDLNLLEEVQNDSGDVTAYKSSPSRRELSNYISTGGFTHRDTFKLIK